MNALAKRIHDLSVLDKARRVFGAKTHDYLGQKVASGDLEALEARNQCRLPVDYRRFLEEIGTGVGPYYGLLSLSKVEEELRMIEEDYQEANAERATPGDSFGLERQVLALKTLRTLDFPNLDCPDTRGGFIPICHHGCEFMTVLVVSGECAGMVMDTTNFDSRPSHWFPAKCPPGIVEYAQQRKPISSFPNWPTFPDWIDGWIRQGVQDLS